MVTTKQNVVAVIHDQLRFLILKKKGRWTGWQFVQGDIDRKESPEHAAVKEVKEETGIKNARLEKELQFKTDYWYNDRKEKVHKFQRWYLIKAKRSDKVKLNIEHSDYEWCTFKQAYNLLTYNKDILKKIYYDMKKFKPNKV